MTDLQTINQLRGELAVVEPDVAKAEVDEVVQTLIEAEAEYHHGTVQALEQAVASARRWLGILQKKAERERFNRLPVAKLQKQNTDVPPPTAKALDPEFTEEELEEQRNIYLGMKYGGFGW